MRAQSNIELSGPTSATPCPNRVASAQSEREQPAAVSRSIRSDPTAWWIADET